jgi:hypothetical protein
MIISKIIGGMGNQLFQYAAGRSLQKLHNCELKLDLFAFENYDLRNFDLSNFNVEINVATLEEIKSLTFSNYLQKVKNKIKPINERTFFKETFFHYNRLFEKLGSNVYIKGYFQSEKYFKPIEELIRKEFSLNSEIIDPVKDLGREISSHNSISIHFRRGDYKNREFYEYHGILSLQYYLDSYKYFNENITNPVYYIFTDDIQWVKSNISLPDSIFVSGEITKNHYEDLYLMSQCRHNIIANSSFSWWAAWLNNHEDKIVIAPKKWFKKGPKDTYDLFPESWKVF